MDTLEGLLAENKQLKKRISRLEAQGHPQWHYLQAPLTSTSWDGDAYSTTAKTLIDLSAVFGAPPGIKAVFVKTAINDSASAAGICLLRLSPTNVNNQGMCNRVSGIVHDMIHEECFEVPCDANGDIYYQIDASGASTLDVVIQIWGYYI